MRTVDGQLRIAAGDVANFVACRHLTRLDLAVAHQLVRAPMVEDVGAKALEERGLEHERQVLEGFRARGWSVDDQRTGGQGWERDSADATAAAMRRRADVIYQGTLLVDDRLGLPDFLVRADLLGSPMGADPLYEVVDAKLARSAKARAVLQATFYSELVGAVQGHMPENMHLALGSQELLHLRVADYAAYTRQVRRLLGTLAEDDAQFPPADTYPEPVEHCAICRWRSTCQQQRRDDDDVSLVAGITARQRKALKQAGIATRRGFAALEEVPNLDRVNRQSMTKAHAQARLQVDG
jgi:predicted RecB family nuclease